MRTCSRCGEAKDILSFHKDVSCRGGRRPDCKDCIKIVRARYRAKNTVRIQQRQRAYMYGITVEHMLLLLSQGCAICGGAAEDIDHNHACCPGPRSCGACVRAALCGHCNRGLGHFRDDQELLLAAVQYLAKF